MVKAKNTKWTRPFTVFAKDTNHMHGIIFGGKFMSEIDMTCGELCRRALYDSPTCKEAYTHKINIEFTAPAKLGDIVIIDAEITNLHKKSMTCTFSAFVERNKTGERIKVANGSAIFVSHNDGEYTHHDLTL